MFNITEIIIDKFVQELRTGYSHTYGRMKHDYEEIIAWAGNMAMENIANTDALYHNVEHSILVTLVGQEILRGKHIREGRVSCEDWLQFIISLICHDIGYLKGICKGDRPYQNLYVTGKGDQIIELSPGSTDASLTNYHVDRGKLFIEERFANHQILNTEVIKTNMELTRFPVPQKQDHQDTKNYPGLVRAADLIGQLSDPRYLQKINALFYEFVETGANKTMGFRNSGDLRQHYPKFYWQSVYPYIQDALAYLNLTQQGKQIIANLYAHVFIVEHEQ